MLLVLVGLLLVALKAAAVGPFAACPWWLAVAPLVLAILWWKFSDATGLDKRREMKRMEERKAERRRSALTATGQSPEAERALAARQREIERVEGRRVSEKERAIALLGEAVEKRSNCLIFLRNDPRWAPIRSDPRFAVLLRRVGLDDTSLASYKR